MIVHIFYFPILWLNYRHCYYLFKRLFKRIDKHTGNGSADTHLILTNFRQGTVFLTQVSVNGSMSSTMTKGASSKVTMLRWLSSGSQSEKDLYLGHTACLRLSVWFSHLPTCITNTKTHLYFLAPLTSKRASPFTSKAQEMSPSVLRILLLSSSTCASTYVLIKMRKKENQSARQVPIPASVEGPASHSGYCRRSSSMYVWD